MRARARVCVRTIRVGFIVNSRRKMEDHSSSDGNAKSFATSSRCTCARARARARERSRTFVYIPPVLPPTFRRRQQQQQQQCFRVQHNKIVRSSSESSGPHNFRSRRSSPSKARDKQIERERDLTDRERDIRFTFFDGYRVISELAVGAIQRYLAGRNFLLETPHITAEE